MAAFVKSTSVLSDIDTWKRIPPINSYQDMTKIQGSVLAAYNYLKRVMASKDDGVTE
jgi:hypothetical protein